MPIPLDILESKVKQAVEELQNLRKDNARLQSECEMLKSQIVRQQYRAILLPGRAKASVREHAAIVAAICAHDEEAAETAMLRHMDGVIAALKQAISLNAGMP